MHQRWSEIQILPSHNLPIKATVLRVLGLAVLFSLLDSSTSAVMILFRGVGFEANSNVHQLYPTFGAISPLIGVPIEVSGFFIMAMVLVTLLMCAELIANTVQKPMPAHVAKLAMGLGFGLTDIFLTYPIVAGAIGNVTATIIGNLQIGWWFYAILVVVIQLGLPYRNIVQHKSIVIGSLSK